MFVSRRDWTSSGDALRVFGRGRRVKLRMSRKSRLSRLNDDKSEDFSSPQLFLIKRGFSERSEALDWVVNRQKIIRECRKTCRDWCVLNVLCVAVEVAVIHVTFDDFSEIARIFITKNHFLSWKRPELSSGPPISFTTPRNLLQADDVTCADGIPYDMESETVRFHVTTFVFRSDYVLLFCFFNSDRGSP